MQILDAGHIDYGYPVPMLDTLAVWCTVDLCLNILCVSQWTKRLVDGAQRTNLLERAGE